MVPAVEGGVHAHFGPGEQEVRPVGVLADRVDPRAGGEPVVHLLPAPAPVAGPVHVGREVVQPVTVHGGPRHCGVRVRGLDHGDLAPRRQGSRRHVLPAPSAVPRDPHQPVVGSGPHRVRVHGRGRDREDDAPAGSGPLDRRPIVCRGRVEVGRHPRRLTGQVGADLLPAGAPVARLEQVLVAEVDGVRVGRGGHDRHGPGHAEGGVGPGELWRDRGPHAGVLVAAHHRPVVGGSEQDVLVQGVDGDVAALTPGAGVSPVPEADAVAATAPAQDPARARVLLGAVQLVGEAVVGDHVVELGRGLVVPRAPAAAAVHAHDHALVGRQDHVARVRGVDPQLVVVVPARRALEALEGGAGVLGAVHARVHDVDDVGVGRVDGHAAEIPAPVPDAVLAVRELPGRAGVVGAVHAPLAGSARGVHLRVYAVGVGRRHGDPDAAHPRAAGEPARHLPPVVTTVGRLEDRPEAVGGGVHVPWRPPRAPQHGEDPVRVRGRGGQVDRSRVPIAVQDLVPRPSTIVRAEHAPLLVGPVRVAQRRHPHPVRIPGIHQDAADAARVVQSDVPPRLPAVVRAVHSVAGRVRGADVRFAGPHVQDGRVRRRHGDRPDGCDGLAVEARSPGETRVAALPHAAVHGAEVEVLGLARHAGGGHRAPRAEGPDQAPAHPREQGGIELLGAGRGRSEGEQGGRGEDGGEDEGWDDRRAAIEAGHRRLLAGVGRRIYGKRWRSATRHRRLPDPHRFSPGPARRGPRREEPFPPGPPARTARPPVSGAFRDLALWRILNEHPKSLPAPAGAHSPSTRAER